MGSNPTPGTCAEQVGRESAFRPTGSETAPCTQMCTNCSGYPRAGGPSTSRAALGPSASTGFHPESGKRREVLRQGFATKKEAQLALADLIQAAEKNAVVAKSTMRLGDYVEEWLGNQPQRPARDNAAQL